MEKKKDSSRPLLYSLKLNFHMQETFHKTLRDEVESAEEKSDEDAYMALNEDFFSANFNVDEVVQKLRKMLGDKLTDEVEKDLLTSWFETIGTMKKSSSLSENGEESLLEEQSMEGV
ncbi:hypothetical protein PB1_02775 [Bacillus methanolicus PB1]|uniref:Uncharacterized protein n=1 Tax=Bacillus methanolicus PB1 TaxID=997296 RepID=I3E5Q7_BACMT|nr:hypothetical protein [Bacillus methanolicus]EIJ81828.1 hypothetical protein PB1_02775 [Bacillus methanolicus PB1]